MKFNMYMCHHHLSASAEIEFTTFLQYTLSVMEVRRSSLAMEVSLLRISGKSNEQYSRQISGDLPRISTQVKRRRIQFTGHCARAIDELVSSFVLWRHPSSLHRSRKLTFPDTLSRDTSIAKDDLLTAMIDRVYWRSVVNSISAEADC